VRPLAAFFGRFWRHRRTLLPGLVAVPLTRLADVAVTVAIGDALNGVTAGRPLAELDAALGWIALYALVQAVFSFAQRWWVNATSRRVECELKQELFDRLTSLSFGYHDRTRSGDLVSRITSDVEEVRMFLGPGLMFALGSLVMVPVTLVLIVRLSPGLAGLMAIPLGIMATAFTWLTPATHRASREVQESQSDLTHHAQESLAGVRVVQGFAREATRAAEFAGLSRVLRDRQVRLARWRGLAHLVSIGASQLTFVVILLVAGRGMIRGTLGAGDTLVFVDLTLKLFWPIIAIGWLAGMYPRAVASAARLTEVLSEVPEIQAPADPVPLGDVRGELSLRGVSFTYPGGARPALEGVDLEVPAGSTLGVVGPVGAGKSTLLRLFGRLHDPEGEVRLDGVPLRRLDPGELRDRLGYVSQEAFLFSDTWAENVAFGADAPLDRARLEELAVAVGMQEELAGFEHGLDQRVGERGVTLSGGQRQRTCIARALARDPRVLVLDDALSAVDTGTESRLVELLRGEGARRTVVIASHRLSAVRHADRILVLSPEGRPAALGTHEELVAAGGWYADAWRRQQARAELEEL
jgi:ATP-binding cassette subfamily B multidrug efflux pump